MGELFLIRHGQANFGATYAEDYDQLSELGHQQANWCGAYLKELGLQFDRAARGILRRHHETLDSLFVGFADRIDAEILPHFNEFDAHAIVDAYLKSINPSPESIINRHADISLLNKAMRAWIRADFALERFETWVEFQKRVMDGLDHLCQFGNGKHILAVTSGGPIAQIARKILNAPPEAMVESSFRTPNTGITRIVFSNSGKYIKGFSNTPHLDSMDRSGALTYA